AKRERLLDMRFAAHAAAELTGNAGHVHNGANALDIDGLALTSPIQIDEVKKRRAFVDPAFCHGCSVGTEDGFLGVDPRPKPHALAAAKGDARKDEHVCDPGSSFEKPTDTFHRIKEILTRRGHRLLAFARGPSHNPYVYAPNGTVSKGYHRGEIQPGG